MALVLGGKTAVVTGAGRGIGKAIALMLGRAGATVVASARSRDEIDATVATIREAGGDGAAITADVTKETEVDTLFRAVGERFGQLDILVNNAGIASSGLLAELDVAEFDAVMATNTRGTFLCCRQAMRMMMPRHSGTIINISSVVGFRGYADQSAYAAAKHGVMGITKSLAREAQEHGVRVCAVSPGGVDTPMIRQTRPDLDASDVMAPEDIAQAVEYLLSLSSRAAVDEIYIRRWKSRPF